MEKGRIKYLVDAGLAVSFIGVAVTGILKWGPVRDALGIVRGTSLMTNMSTIHDYSGLVMAALVLIHLYLSKEWIICETKNIFEKLLKR